MAATTILALYFITSGALTLFVIRLLSRTTRLDFLVVSCQSQTSSLSVYIVTVVFTLADYSAHQFIRFSDTLLYTPFFFVLVRIYFCSFMAMSVPAFPLPHPSHS